MVDEVINHFFMKFNIFMKTVVGNELRGVLLSKEFNNLWAENIAKGEAPLIGGASV